MTARKNPPSRKKPRPTGKLAEPIKIVLASPMLACGQAHPEALKDNPAAQQSAREAMAAVEKANAAEWRRAFSESMNRLELLFPHYRLNRTGDDAMDFRLLSLAMAMECFPGFRVEDVNEGEPYTHKRSNPQTLVLLLADIEIIKQENGGAITDPEAIRILRTDARFSREWGSTMREAKSLQNWLCEARNPTINVYWPMWQAGPIQKLALTMWVNILARGQLRPGGSTLRPSRKSSQ